MITSKYRAYDLLTEWLGPVRSTPAAAEKDAHGHAVRCRAQGGYARAIVITPDPEAPARSVDLDGVPVWPPHGRTCGTVRFRA